MPALPPGPRLPRAVQTAAWITRPGPFMVRAQARHGDVFTIRIGDEPPWLMLAHPDAVKEVFTGDPAVFHAGKANLILRPLVGHASVLLLDGPQHMAQRKLMLPPFHGSRMAGYEALVREIAAGHVATWPRGTTVPLAPRMQSITLDVVLRVIFGIEADSARLAGLREALRAMLGRVFSGGSMLAMSGLGPRNVERAHLFDRWLRPVDALLHEQIEARRRAPGDDVLSLLLAARHADGAPMSDRELRDELVTLLVAGHETTATALSWTVERLVRTPGGWDALRAGGDAYAEAAAKEALRLRPVLPVVLRSLQAPATVAGLELEAGTLVAPSIFLVHRRPGLYPDPAAFRPERFLGPEPQGGTYTWIPFGGGVRRCLGAAFALMELRVVLAELAARTAAAAPRPEREPTGRRAITLIPKRGAEVVLS